MKVKLSPTTSDEILSVVKAGQTLTVNGELFNFIPMNDGDTLPSSAISSKWFYGDVDKEDGELILTIFLPNPWNYSLEQAFPIDLVNVPDGPIVFPQPLPASKT